MDRPRAPLRFLVVEDEALLSMDLVMMIEDAGHGVVAEVGCLREVQGLDAAMSPHVAFVDVHLAEGSSGLDVCAFIREHWSQTIVVFVTANPKLVRHEAGGHALLSKPFSRHGVMSALRYITEGVCAPPPISTLPPEFTAFPALAATWAV